MGSTTRWGKKESLIMGLKSKLEDLGQPGSRMNVCWRRSHARATTLVCEFVNRIKINVLKSSLQQGREILTTLPRFDDN